VTEDKKQEQCGGERNVQLTKRRGNFYVTDSAAHDVRHGVELRARRPNSARKRKLSPREGEASHLTARPSVKDFPKGRA